MELTPDQHAAARGRGLAFFPATDEQVRRLTAQRRVFRLDGRPFLATRDGAFRETHGVLLWLIEDQPRAAPVGGADAGAPPDARAASHDREPQTGGGGGAEPAEALREGGDAPPPEAHGRRTRRPRAAPVGGGAAAAGEIATEASGADEGAAKAGQAAASGPETRVVGRRRAGRPEAPRSMVAGKLRRGRLR